MALHLERHSSKVLESANLAINLDRVAPEIQSGSVKRAGFLLQGIVHLLGNGYFLVVRKPQ